MVSRIDAIPKWWSAASVKTDVIEQRLVSCANGTRVFTVFFAIDDYAVSISETFKLCVKGSYKPTHAFAHFWVALKNILSDHAIQEGLPHGISSASSEISKGVKVVEHTSFEISNKKNLNDNP